jgi:uncharacterized membrane protein (UPF0127 family)
MRIENRTRGTLLAERAAEACSSWARFVGLMGRNALPPGAGLLLPGVRGVHTHFMRFPIDVVFLDRAGVVVGRALDLRPWRFSRYYRRAQAALELPAGTIAASGTETGDEIAGSLVRNADPYGVLALIPHADRYDWELGPEPGKESRDVGSATCR